MTDSTFFLVTTILPLLGFVVLVLVMAYDNHKEGQRAF